MDPICSKVNMVSVCHVILEPIRFPQSYLCVFVYSPSSTMSSSGAQNDELVEDRLEGGELGGEGGDIQSIKEEEGEGSEKGRVDDTLEAKQTSSTKLTA